MSVDVIQFGKDLTAFAKKVDALPGQVQQQIGLAIYRAVKEGTPVDTGFAKSNWQATFGEVANGTRPIGDYTSQDEGVVIGSSEIGKIVLWISNRVPYINALEYGHSKQAPEGMARISVELVRARMDELLRAANAASIQERLSAHGL